MSQGQTLGRIWVFDEDNLEQAIESYQTEALAAYPQQEERIRTTLLAVRDFLHSEHAARLVMGGNHGQDVATVDTRN